LSLVDLRFALHRLATLALHTRHLLALHDDPTRTGRQNRGNPASIGDHTWTVTLMLDGNTPDKQECSGTLVAPTKVVTAAHCYDYEAGDTGQPYPPSPPRVAKRWTVIAGP
jgi:hypothetical protein